MGEMIEIFCQECNYRKEISLGVGMEYFSVENVLELVHPSCWKEFKDIFHNHEILSKDCCHTLFRCVKCNALYGRFHVKICYQTQDGAKRTYETHHFCSKCQRELTPVSVVEEIDEDDYGGEQETLASSIKQLPCPGCAKKSLAIQNIGYWD
jgi:hypothetical protein